MTHYFITLAIVELAAVQTESLDRGRRDAAAVGAGARLRDLLKYEFFFATKREFDTDVRREAALANPDWAGESLSPSELAQGLRSSRSLLSHRVVGPFLEAYQVVADRLAVKEPAAPVDPDALVLECLGVAQQRWLQQELHSPQSITKDVMNGAIKLADNRGLLGPGGAQLQAERQLFADELAEAVRAVDVVRSPGATSLPSAPRPRLRDDPRRAATDG